MSLIGNSPNLVDTTKGTGYLYFVRLVDPAFPFRQPTTQKREVVVKPHPSVPEQDRRQSVVEGVPLGEVRNTFQL